MKENNLFSANAVFVSDASDPTTIFKEVSDKLLALDLVNDGFFNGINQREQQYPTGIDTSPIAKELPNIAVPHTEGEFVNTCLIVPVALKAPVSFKNMIAPDQSLPVKFLFMILNDNPEGQANILAQIMDFLRLTSVSKLQTLFNLTETDKIYQFLSENFSRQ